MVVVSIAPIVQGLARVWLPQSSVVHAVAAPNAGESDNGVASNAAAISLFSSGSTQIRPLPQVLLR